MKYCFSIFITLCILSTSAQVVEDLRPINPYYLKIQYALLPEPENNRKGIIFYTCDTGYINGFVRDMVKSVFEETKDDYSYYKFKKNKFRFSGYRCLIQDISYRSQNNFRSFTDTTVLDIVANKYKRKWNWKRFRFRLKFISVDTIYSGTFSSSISFKSSTKLLHHLISTNPRISLVIDGQVVYANELAVSELPVVLQELPANFDDYIVRTNRLFNTIESQYVYIKFEKAFKAVLFYFPF